MGRRLITGTYSVQHLALPGVMVGKRLRELAALAGHDSAEKEKKIVNRSSSTQGLAYMYTWCRQ